MATLIYSDGSSKEVQPKNGTDFKLHEVYELLDISMVEIVYLKKPTIMLCDEEGLFSDKDTNQTASDMALGYAYMDERGIVGNVLICKNSEFR